ncbi:MAG: DMT family transporter [Bacteroidaceae bacterium]|nr:DMT family transporter [Bacteroidaceae bacterium]
MWLGFAFLSACLLGFYDVFKKHSLRENAVIPVLFLNTLFCSLIFLPALILSSSGWLREGDMLFAPTEGWEVQRFILLKSLIVLSSWILGYVGIKYIPITIVGPINATRPVWALLGALLIFSERLSPLQWVGVLTAMLSFWLLSRSGKKEGIDFRHNRWIICLVFSAILGAVSGLYDKFLMAQPENGGLGLNRMEVQAWFNIYQCGMMGVMLLLLWFSARTRFASFRWSWSILCISIFLSVADFAYFYALSLDGALISIVSMARRSSVIVSFIFGAMVFREKNLRSKAIDLALVLLSMVFLWLGSN